MSSWFKKPTEATTNAQPTLADGLAALERCGVRKNDDIPIEDILLSTGGTLTDPIEYTELLCLIGGDVERDDFPPMSSDLWHFDTECITDDGDYVRIANRLVILSKGALAITNIQDHVDIEESVAWLEFDFRGQRIRWELEVQNDWVDASLFSRFVKLFREIESEALFTYADLGGQDCLIGFATDAQRRALTTLTGLDFVWLS